jgi:hypothetical protein
MSFSIFIGVLVVAYILLRQIRVRAVPRVAAVRLPIILVVIGFFEFVSYTGDHHVSTGAYEWALGTLVVGAILLGALRAVTVKLWTANNWVLRQGTWLTMLLWGISLALHFVSDRHAGASNLEAASFLLYIGLTYGVQNYVVHLRARPLWDSLGPEAGQRFTVNFGQGPGGANAFFTTMFGGQGFPPPPSSPPTSAPYDPTITDVEVVDDDEGDGPAQLHRPDA